MDAELEELYFNWLIAKVNVDHHGKSYLELFKVLQNTEYAWIVSMDDNRAGDGIELRRYYQDATGITVDRSWEDLPCSMLEFFIAFADRANFQINDPISDWFWTFMDNLGLSEFDDEHMDYEAVSEIIFTFVWRRYDYDGKNGGMLPIRRNCKQDQRKLQIWDQFFRYLESEGRMFE
jgi:hypothetical protein